MWMAVIGLRTSVLRKKNKQQRFGLKHSWLKFGRLVLFQTVMQF